MHSNYKDEGGIIVIWKRNSAKLQRGIYRAEGRKEGKGGTSFSVELALIIDQSGG